MELIVLMFLDHFRMESFCCSLILIKKNKNEVANMLCLNYLAFETCEPRVCFE